MELEDKKKILDAFQKYVATYDPAVNMNSIEGFMQDMIYGIGSAIDHDKYKFADGYKLFLKEVKKEVIERNNV